MPAGRRSAGAELTERRAADAPITWPAHTLACAAPAPPGGALPWCLQASYRGAALHHYISRSLADFEAKQARRAGDGSVKTLAHFLQWHRAATGTCTAAVPLGRALAARWDLNRNVPQRCLLWAQD